ncbi:RNA polymerase sigma factor [Virgisporangium aliadipatigenens]|uniref:RNA polymerase sigma factor n=1 Tax=Virgisporangium aliadipatigenens TaxID=741659 RepID=UPI0019408D48|nr:RNA polymerase sigma factor [Virgisporangium aliadipatigenens]
MADGRTARFEALYAATFDRILGYAVRRCDSAEDAADVVAETFAIAWRRIDAVPSGEAARLWLYVVARNVLANHRRGQVRRHTLARAVADQVRGRYAPAADESVEAQAVRTAFDRMSEEDREVLALVAWEGLDAGGVATVLGCSRNAARIRIHRARRRLRHHLAADSPAIPGGAR